MENIPIMRQRHITCTLTVDIRHDTIEHALEIIRQKLAMVETDPEPEPCVSVTIDGVGHEIVRTLREPVPANFPNPDVFSGFFGLSGRYEKRPEGRREHITEPFKGDRDVLS